MEKICKECGKLFSLKYRNANSLYCSDTCRMIAKNKRKQKQKKERFKNGDKEFILKTKYDKYKRNAERRNLPFELSRKEFDKHYNKSCHYCGETVNYIGLDRKDSAKGYTINNIVDCCTECNLIKRKTPYDEFIQKITQIYFYLSGGAP